MKFERDEVEFLGRCAARAHDRLPVAIIVHNSEWSTGKWNDEMSSAPGATKSPLTQPRPGHADLAGMQKYGFTECARRARACERA
jgi:chorismate synthase